MDKKWTSGNELKYLKEVLSNTDKVKSKPFTDRIEKAFCERYGVNYAIAMNSATSAIHVALHVLGVKSALEIIVKQRLHAINSIATNAVDLVKKFPADLENI